MKNEILRIPLTEMKSVLVEKLIKHGMENSKAKVCADVFSENTLDGVFTHGVNRFARFIEYIDKQVVKVDNEPKLVHRAGSIEQWDGQFGPGILNAFKSTDRAIEIAKSNGIGMVALARTSHWMRGGTYGWYAAKKGFAYIGWTNTIPLMPAYGAVDSRLGNNPIVLAVPYNDEAVVLDMALTQFSYGKMEALKIKSDKLSFDGGYDKNGNLTDDPAKILESKRPLQIGAWKGSGLALLLDLFAAILSGGFSTKEIGSFETEQGLSQVFIAVDLSKLNNSNSISRAINNIIDDYLKSIPENESAQINYPGQRTLQRRNENISNGIPVDKIIWDEIIKL